MFKQTKHEKVGKTTNTDDKMRKTRRKQTDKQHKQTDKMLFGQPRAVQTAIRFINSER